MITRPRASSTFDANNILEPMWLIGDWKVIDGSMNILKDSEEVKWNIKTFSIAKGPANGREDCPLVTVKYDVVTSGDEGSEGLISGVWGIQKEPSGTTFVFMNLETAVTAMKVDLALLVRGLDLEKKIGKLELLSQDANTGMYVKSGQIITIGAEEYLLCLWS